MGNEAEKKTIKQIQTYHFEIPPYQRLYAWGETEINTLLDDMKNACELDKKDACELDKKDEKVENKKEYFIGNITTSKKIENGQEIYVLIDGQQRLTTLWFIGFYLASKGCGEWDKFIMIGNKLRIAMPIRDSEENALKALARKILQKQIKEKLAESLKTKDKDIDEKMKNIIGAFECIESWFKNIEKIKENEIKDFAEYIYMKVCFVFVTLADNTDLNRFFVRMNNRGKQLEKHEILKARILQKIDKNEQEKYAKIWDLCSDMNKYIFQSANDRQILEKDNKDDDKPNRIESMIDFSTFLLHCYKLHNNNNEVPILKDNLLKNVKLDNLNCKNFIKDMLYYRVLFDYFVIKNDTDIKQGNTFKIRRLQSYKSKNNKKYYRLPDDGESATDNSPLKTLATIQNYLRVARRGANQNYHHWLTPFLKFLSEKVNIGGKIIAWGNFDNFNKIAEYFDSKNDSNNESDMVSFLENLDTKLATHQLGENNEKGLLDIANLILKDLKTDLNDNEQKSVDDFSRLKIWDFLNKGTATPHYWFYRLEYYLWKNGVKNDDNLQIGGKKFSNIREKFYFRNLNSVEHIHPQSVDGWGKDNEIREIDKFGNLALLSVSFNSSLNDNAGQEKYTKLLAKVQKDEVESLKLWLVYAKNYDKEKESWEWDKDKAKAHQNQMLKILKESLGLNPNDSQDSCESQGK